MNLMTPKFPIGRTTATAAVVAWAEENEIDLARLLRKHHCGDWGDIDAEDTAANEEALKEGARILSVYRLYGEKTYIITEADRSYTTIMFAREY